MHIRQCGVPGDIVQYCDSGADKPETIILLHGIGASAATWNNLAIALRGRLRTLAWNAPGYASSSPLPMDQPCMVDYAAAMTRFLDAIQVERVHLCASSWGALVALAWAAHAPDRVDRVILCGPSAGYTLLPESQRAELLTQRTKRVQQYSPQRMLRDDGCRLVASGNYTALKGQLEEDAREVRGQGYLQALHALMRCDGVELIRQVHSPLLLVCGAQDQVAPLAVHGQRLADAQPRAQLRIYPDCGHLPHLEQPARLSADILSFLDSHIG